MGAMRPYRKDARMRPLALKPLSSKSYDANDPIHLVAWLAERGFKYIGTSRSQHELARMSGPLDSLIVIYKSGATVVQGYHQDDSRELLNGLVASHE